MDITPISKEAFAVLAECEETRKPFGITIDPRGRDLRFIWAFKIDRSKAQREGFASHSVNGVITLDANFNGCPHCGSMPSRGDRCLSHSSPHTCPRD